MSIDPLTCMREGPGSVYENNVGCEQHYEDAVGQRDQATVPLGSPLGEGADKQEVETQPANQAADDLQHRHGCVFGKNRHIWGLLHETGSKKKSLKV